MHNFCIRPSGRIARKTTAAHWLDLLGHLWHFPSVFPSLVSFSVDLIPSREWARGWLTGKDLFIALFFGYVLLFQFWVDLLYSDGVFCSETPADLPGSYNYHCDGGGRETGLAQQTGAAHLFPAGEVFIGIKPPRIEWPIEQQTQNTGFRRILSAVALAF